MAISSAAENNSTAAIRPAWHDSAGRLALVALSALCFVLAFPGGSLPLLGWVAMAPLALALRGIAPGRGFALAGLFGLACWLGTTWWIPPAVMTMTGGGDAVAWPAYLLFCAWSALPYALFGAAHGLARWGDSPADSLGAAAMLTALIYAIPQPLPGNLAHSQYLQTELIQLVDLGGVPLLLLAMNLSGWTVAAVVHRAVTARRLHVPAAAAGIAVLLAVAGYGHYRIDTIRTAMAGAPIIHVGVVQPNLPIHWRQLTDGGLPRFDTLSRQLMEKHPRPDVVVWPEVPTPFSYPDDAANRHQVGRLLNRFDTPFMVASGWVRAGRMVGGAPAYYGGSELVTRTGVQGYLKQRLLPFGEYLPLEQHFPQLRRLFPNALRYVAGNRPGLFRVKAGAKAIPVICYEALFPDLVARGVALGGNLIVNQGDDLWFGHTPEPRIHLALSLFRSVEFRLPLVFASNSGISAAVDASGHLAQGTELPQFTAAARTYTVALPRVSSPFATVGDLPLAAIAVFAAGGLLLRLVRRRGAATA